MKKALGFKITADIVNFIRAYAEHNALFLPGRQTGHFNMCAKLLPTLNLKRKIYDDVYEKSCETNGCEPVSLITFCCLLRQFYPDIVVMKPKTNLCSFCQQNFTSGRWNACLANDEKV